MRLATPQMVIWGGIGILLVVAFAYAFRPQPERVDLAIAEQGRLLVSVGDEGQTQVREIYTLAAPVHGRLMRLQGKVGDGVRQGVSELAKIEPAKPAFLDVRSESEARATVKAAEAGLMLAEAEWERAKAELAFASSEFERAHALFKRGTVAQQKLDVMQRAHRVAGAEVLTAQASLDRRRHELELARAKLLSREQLDEMGQGCNCLVMRAPVDGRILRVFEESETVVEAGTPLLEIGNPRDLEVVVDLLSADAVKVMPGQQALISGWGGEDLRAVVRRVEPYGYTKVSALGIDEQRVDVLLSLADPHDAWRRLGHGYRVDVSITLEEADVLRVPLGALFRDQGGWAVYALRDGQARLQPVELGLRNALHAEVRAGLAEGEAVVLHPGDAIRDGTAIEKR